MSKTIDALEKIDQATFHCLCDDILITNYFGYKKILPIGVNKKKLKTIKGSPDSIIFQGEKGAIVFEYTTNKDFKKKLKADLKIIKEKFEKKDTKIKKFVFVTSGMKENIDGHTPKEYTKINFNWDAEIYDQQALSLCLDNSNYFHIRRKYLQIYDDYFLSRDNFEKIIINRIKKVAAYSEKFLNREKKIQLLREFLLDTDIQTIYLHSVGGFGKTRFLIEAVRQFEKDKSFEDIDFLFNDLFKTDITISDHMHEIVPEKEKSSIVVIDDAHKINNLHEFQRILSERPSSKIIFSTRTTAKAKVINEIGIVNHHEIKLARLEDQIIYDLIKNNLKKALPDDVLEYLTSICEGNPLIAEVYSRIINDNIITSLTAIRKCDPLKIYFQNTLIEIEKSQEKITNKYKQYISLIFGLKPFSLEDKKIRKIIRNIIRIDEFEEKTIIENLIRIGIFEKVGNSLWIYPDLLGEYIFEIVFFSDFSSDDIEEVIDKIPYEKKQSLLKTIREIDSPKSNEFLGEIADDIAREIEKGNNDQRINYLEVLKIIANNVHNHVLRIIKSIISEDEVLPIKYQHPYSVTGRTHLDVLLECIGILNLIKYQNFTEVIELFSELSFYKKNIENYSRLRKEALENIEQASRYDLSIMQRAGYFFQKQLFKTIFIWKDKDLIKYFELLTKLCKKLLEPYFEYQHASLLDHNKFQFGRGPLHINDDLVKLRKDVISFLKEIFYKLKSDQQKITILEALFEATHYPMNLELDSDLGKVVHDNRREIVEFCSDVIEKTESPAIMKNIEMEAVLMRRTKRKGLLALDNLINKIRNNEFYAIYRTFVGGYIDIISEDEDWTETRKQRIRKLDDFIKEINEKNYDYWIPILNKIANTYEEGKKYEFSYFEHFCFSLGQQKPEIAKILVDVGHKQHTSIKRFFPQLLKGIKSSLRSQIANNYISNWLNSKNYELISIIPEIYSFIEERYVNKCDVKFFKKLVKYKLKDKTQKTQLKQKVFENIFYIHKADPKLVQKMILKLLRKSSPKFASFYFKHIELAQIREKIDMNQWRDRIFHALINKMVLISSLSFEHLYILSLYGKKYPFKLIDFFDTRFKRKQELKHRVDDIYYPIPYHLSYVDNMYQTHPKYKKVIEKILKLIHRENRELKFDRIRLLVRISPKLDDNLKQILLNDVLTADKKKILNVIRILRSYKIQRNTHMDLLKEAIKKSGGDKDILSSMNSIFIQTGIVIGERGIIKAYEARINSLKDWTKDSNNFVIKFSEQMISDLNKLIEKEERRIKEMDIRFRKGFF